MPVDLTGLTPEAIVGDVVISQALTPILTAAPDARMPRAAGGGDDRSPVVATMAAAFLGLENGDWSAEAIARLI